MVPTMPTRELYVQGTQGQPPGIEPPHWTTEDFRSRHWAVYVSYHLQGGGKNAIRIFSHFPHFFSHFLGRSLSVMFKRIHSSGIV